MPQFKCYPITDPNANWNYCPSFPAAILFCVLFGMITIVHMTQASIYKKPFALVICMGAAWECGGYVFRILSVMHELNSAFATAQFLLILLAPLWINAFTYMVLGRAIHFFLDDDRVFGIRARRITLMFVLFDIAAFLVQATGGAMTSNSEPASTQRLGLHIYMGGVGLQLLFICVFIALAVQFQRKMYTVLNQKDISKPSLLSLFRKSTNMQYNIQGASEEASTNEVYKSPERAVRLLYVVYAVLGLIIFRNIYRLIEFSQGVLSNITTHEWYWYVFDAVPMLFALIISSCFHPGRVLRGPRCDFSEENREIKAAKKAKKMAERQERDEKARDKRRAKAERRAEKQAGRT
jgi:signal transduction histidine kinase